MKIIALANQKGGVGKTTTTLNIGAALADLGRRVLMVDLDPQASLTLATIGESPNRNIAAVLGDSKPGNMKMDAIIKPVGDSGRLFIAPGDLTLAAAELGLVQRLGRETILKKALATMTGFDVVLIDCSPSLGLLVVNALAAADAVITPTLPTALDLRGLRLFLSSLDAIRDLNPGLELLGVLICQYDQRIKLHQSALVEIQGGGLPVLGMISRSVQAAASAGVGLPLASGILADQYKQVGKDINQWLNNK